jgi:hypothetical protein
MTVESLRVVVVFISLIISGALLGLFMGLALYLPGFSAISPSGENQNIQDAARGTSDRADITQIPAHMLTPDTLPYSGVSIGFYENRASISPFPSPEFWYNTGDDAAGKFPGSEIGAIWVVGIATGEGICNLMFPSSTSYSDVLFSATDESEAYLNYYDSKGIKVILQLEPGNADVSTLIKLVLDRYSKHPCVAGIGIDVEWYKGGRAITDQEASQWYNQIASYNKNYKLALTHWQASKMPPTYRTGLYFIYDGQQFGSLSSMKNYYTSWANSFPNSPVGIYIGFPSDKTWWGQYSDPLSTLTSAALASAKNTKGVYWVSYSARDLYPL